MHYTRYTGFITTTQSGNKNISGIYIKEMKEYTNDYK